MTNSVFDGGGHKCLTVSCPDKHASNEAAARGRWAAIARSHCRVAAAGERQGHMVAPESLLSQVRTTLYPRASAGRNILSEPGIESPPPSDRTVPIRYPRTALFDQWIPIRVLRGRRRMAARMLARPELTRYEIVPLKGWGAQKTSLPS